MNLRTMLENTRTRLGEDLRDQYPSSKLLLLLLSTQVQTFLTRANLGGRAWAVDELVLMVGGDVAEYALPIDSSFGKPLEVFTYYPSDPSHIARDIDFVDLGSSYTGWELPGNYSGWSYDGSPNNAQRMAFLRKSGQDQIYVRVLPVPHETAQYKILYQIGVYGETAALDDTPLLPAHHALIEVRTALAALPHAQWSTDKADNQARRNDLRPTLLAEEALLDRNFRESVISLSADYRPSSRIAPGGID